MKLSLELYVMKSKRSRKAFTRRGRFFVYIVQCGDGTYYTGYTKDIKNRIALHKSGKGAKYVKYKLPAELVYAKEYCYYKSAIKEEKRIKTLSRERKTKLIRAFIESNSKMKGCNDETMV